ncbi:MULTISPECIES: hypothetical protein [unclassified Burkholderia]|uniref:hypothetical protein n=1 Tax=unclassified Burkholderia TaxID=2613784 RepID=UPI002AB254F8|nr:MULTISPECIES: hypothetical protein [unclassified Burkholderia]
MLDPILCTARGRVVDPDVPSAAFTLLAVTLGVVCAPFEHKLLRRVRVALGPQRAIVVDRASLVLGVLMLRVLTLILFPISVPLLFFLARHEQRRAHARRAEMRDELDRQLGLQ